MQLHFCIKNNYFNFKNYKGFMMNLTQEILIGKEFTELINLQRSEINIDFQLNQTLSGSIWKSIPRGHKWLHYFKIYDREFLHLRGQKLNILEIGVYHGASLKLWHKYFQGKASIVGVDINPECIKFNDPVNNIHVEIGSQDDPEFLNQVIKKYGPFDLIIDDGSHMVSHQIASFNSLFINGLKDDAIYFIEDLEGNYWNNGLKNQEFTTIDLIKSLIDFQNEVYVGKSYANFLNNSHDKVNDFTISKISTLVNSITTYTGVVSIHKSNSAFPPLGIHL
jgi:hypothetical protein